MGPWLRNSTKTEYFNLGREWKEFKGSNLFTKRLEIDPEGERITASFLVAFTFHKIEIKS